MSQEINYLRVCIDARLISGTRGGVEQFVVGLAYGLSKLTDGDEEYSFLIYEGQGHWIEPYIRGRHHLLVCPPPPSHPSSRWLRGLRLIKSKLSSGRVLRKAQRSEATLFAPLPASDGTIEKTGVDLIHFTMQSGFLTNVPSLYHPWDLQHRHLPEYFTPHERASRDIQYRQLCEQAAFVCVASAWTKEDLIKYFQLPVNKIAVIPVAPVVSAYSQPNAESNAAVTKKYSLPEKFVFYPAQTWAHKNHLRLLQALALLRKENGLEIHLVASGRQNEFYTSISNLVKELGLVENVHFLGFVPEGELQSLYQLSHCLVFPSEFEGWGMPVTEAFLAGVPVACSNVTSLPDLVGDAALLFDPSQPQDIAEAIRKLWTDESLREQLIVLGRQRVSQFNWEHIARIYRALYRRVADKNFSEEDASLLAEALI